MTTGIKNAYIQIRIFFGTQYQIPNLVQTKTIMKIIIKSVSHHKRIIYKEYHHEVLEYTYTQVNQILYNMCCMH